MMLGHGLASAPMEAAQCTLAQTETMMNRAGIASPLRFTAAFTDGRTLYAVRYASDGQPPSLYVRSGLTAGEGTLVASEPLDESSADWQPVPPQTFVTVTASGIESRPFSTAPISSLAA
jgi:glutamine amidotransferase